MRGSSFIISGLFLFSILGALVNAQLPAPRLDSIFPMGGKAGDSVDITLKGADLTGDGQLFFNDPGITSEPLGKGVFKVKIAGEVRSGSYDLRYGGKDGTTSPISFAVSKRDERITPKDATDKSKAVLLEDNVVINGIMEQGKAHYYKFPVRNGGRYFVDCFAERIDSRADALLVLTDPSGIEVARSRESVGGDPLVGFTATIEGEYILRVSDFLTRGGDGYNYRIQLRQGPQIDFVLPLSAQPGKTQSFQVFGKNLPGGVPSGEDGLERIEINIDVPTEMERRKTMPVRPSGAGVKGFHYELGEGSNISNSVFIARSNFQPVIDGGSNSSPEDAQEIPFPSELSGRFYPGKKSWFSFNAVKDKEYVIEVVAHRLVSYCDPTITVVKVIADGEGKEKSTQLAKADDQEANVGGRRYPTNSRDPIYRFKADADCKVRVSVGDNFATKAPFRMIVREPRPDFDLLVSASAPAGDNNKGKKIVREGIAIRRGQVGNLDVYVLRRDGFDGEIELKAEGFPKSFNVKTTKLGKGKNHCSLSFYNAEDAPAWAGKVKIIGEADVQGTKIQKEAESLTVNWSVNDADNERVISRTSSEITVASIEERTPMTVVPAEEKVWESSLGGNLEIPIKFITTSEIKDKVTIVPVNFPGMGKAPQIQVAKEKTKESHKLIIPLLNNKDNNKYQEGTHQFVLKASTKLGYRRDLQVLQTAETEKKNAAKILEETKKSVDALKKELESTRKSLAEAKSSGAETEEEKKKKINDAESKIGSAEEALKQAEKQLKEAEDKNKNADQKLKQATDRSKPKDVQFISYSKPVTVKIESCPIKLKGIDSPIELGKGLKSTVPVSFDRLYGFADGVSLTAKLPDGTKGVKLMEGSANKDQSVINLPVEVAADAKSGLIELELIAKLKFNGIDLQTKGNVSVKITEPPAAPEEPPAAPEEPPAAPEEPPAAPEEPPAVN